MLQIQFRDFGLLATQCTAPFRAGGAYVIRCADHLDLDRVTFFCTQASDDDLGHVFGKAVGISGPLKSQRAQKVVGAE
jgi:hypothetical protein